MPVAVASTAGAEPEECHFLKHPPYQSWPAGFTGPAGASAAGNVDIRALDVSSDAKTLTVRLQLRDLRQQDPLTAVGVSYDVAPVISANRLHLRADVDRTGTYFFVFTEEVSETTGESSAFNLPTGVVPVAGRIDAQASMITITAPWPAFRLSHPPQVRKRVASWYASTTRMAGTNPTGGVGIAGDHAYTTRSYRVGDSPCGRIRPA
ncbi:MAG: hypothetical protein LC640_12255 [Frankia sp.]|nr:hypothetical protein [Frankia sp.]